MGTIKKIIKTVLKIKSDTNLNKDELMKECKACKRDNFILSEQVVEKVNISDQD